MARGTSGRIVIEIDPETKQELYEQLEKENSNMKAWFLAHVENFLKGKQQLTPVSYTHLDVYKRQGSDRWKHQHPPFRFYAK